MPYITQRDRAGLVDRLPRTSGELNYVLTMVCREYLKTQGLSYQTINDVLGALSGAAREFYRRVAAPYEDRKIEENGDVYPQDLLP